MKYVYLCDAESMHESLITPEVAHKLFIVVEDRDLFGARKCKLGGEKVKRPFTSCEAQGKLINLDPA